MPDPTDVPNDSASLKTELSILQGELESTQQKLQRVQNLLEKAKLHNEQLLSEIQRLTAELLAATAASNVSKSQCDIGVQVDLAVEQEYVAVQMTSDAETHLDEEASPLEDVQLKSEAISSQMDTELAQEPNKDGVSLADSLRATAEQAMEQSGYVYDDRTGLYYDHSSGYYYDSEKSLYYEPTSGTYYYYDAESQSYQFHSQVDLTQYTDSYHQYYRDRGMHMEGGKKKSQTEARKSKSQNKTSRSSSNKESSRKRDGTLDDRRNRKRKLEGKPQTRSRSSVERSGNKKKTSKKDEKHKKKKKKLKITKGPDSIVDQDSCSDTKAVYESDEEESLKDGTCNEEGTNSVNGNECDGIYSDVIDEAADAVCSDSATNDAAIDEEITVVKVEKPTSETDEVMSPSPGLTVAKEGGNADSGMLSEGEVMEHDIKSVIMIHTENRACDSEMEEGELTDSSSSSTLYVSPFSDESGGESSVAYRKHSNRHKRRIVENRGVKKEKYSDDEYRSRYYSGDDSDKEYSDRGRRYREKHVKRKRHSNRTAKTRDELYKGKKRRRPRSETSSSEHESFTDEQPLEENVEDLATLYPPCIRAIVKESDSLDPGKLVIFTCTGGTIGREKDLGHTLLIPDLQVSKMHCDLQYDETSSQYTVQDHASQNGTFLNKDRLSQPKTLSERVPIAHCDVLELGGTQLELHIHRGTQTCAGCEPGLLQASAQQKPEVPEISVANKAAKELDRRKQMKLLKIKFGLQKEAYEQKQIALNPKYEDKAAERRKQVGSDNPYQKDDAPASVHRPIAEENKGRKLLQGMGWQEGEGLGRSQSGITEPIQAHVRLKQSAGLGSDTFLQRSLDDSADVRVMDKWVKAKQRFDSLEGSTRRVDNSPGVGPLQHAKTMNMGPKLFLKGETFDPSAVPMEISALERKVQIRDCSTKPDQPTLSRSSEMVVKEEPSVVTKTSIGKIKWVKREKDTMVNVPKVELQSTCAVFAQADSDSEEDNSKAA